MIARSVTLTLVPVRGVRRRVTECASCGNVRPLITRGLCDRCRHRHRDNGTLDDFGYLKADRVQDYAWLRKSGETLPVAASRIGVSERTAWRYEAELRSAA